MPNTRPIHEAIRSAGRRRILILVSKSYPSARRTRPARCGFVSRGMSALAGLIAAAGAAAALAHPAEPPEVFLIPIGTQWRYYAGPIPPGARWKDAEFDDSGWESGTAGFGYGDGDDETILDEMPGRYARVYLRREFHLSSVPDKLYLYIRYDDAFLAYLNGRLAARVNIERGQVLDDHEAEQLEVFELSARGLKTGRNVLAIEGLNVSLDSSDFSLNPALAVAFIPRHVILGESARRDLAYLRSRLLTQSSYLEKSDHDVIEALDSVSGRLPDAMLSIDFLRAVQQLIGLIGDGHASAGAPYEDDNARYLPFRLADADKSVLAVDPGGPPRAFAEPGFPLIVSIDGVPIDHWIEAAGRYFAYVSPQLNRRRAVRSIRRVDKLRADLGLAATADVTVTFAGANGAITRTFPLSERRPRSIRSVVLGDSRILPGNVGYLMIPEMEMGLIPEILDFMDEAEKTAALIIDVRGNGGGRLEILRALAPYFLPPDAPALVTNIAAYRLAPHFRPDHLADRPTLRLHHPGWTESEREVIRAALAGFQPMWPLPPGKFSDWHFMLVNRQSDRTSRVYHYDRPVAVLSNEHGLSATDGFLAGFCEIPDTILVGQPSSGASGRVRYFTLPESDIEVGLSSMASFRPNGQLFDGFGIDVDYHAVPLAEDFIGKSDNVLSAALDMLKRKIESGKPPMAGDARPCRRLSAPPEGAQQPPQ